MSTKLFQTPRLSDVFVFHFFRYSRFVVVEEKDTEETWETLRAGLSAKWSPEQLFSLRLVELIDF